jgi:hypothetical protein
MADDQVIALLQEIRDLQKLHRELGAKRPPARGTALITLSSDAGRRASVWR